MDLKALYKRRPVSLLCTLLDLQLLLLTTANEYESCPGQGKAHAFVTLCGDERKQNTPSSSQNQRAMQTLLWHHTLQQMYCGTFESWFQCSTALNHHISAFSFQILIAAILLNRTCMFHTCLQFCCN